MGEHVKNIDAKPAHSSILQLCGKTYRVHRSFALILGLEEVFGSLGVLTDRLRRHDVSVADIVRMYQLMIDDAGQEVDLKGLQDHVFNSGIPASIGQIYEITLMLFMGADAASDALSLDEDDESAAPENPMTAV